MQHLTDGNICNLVQRPAFCCGACLQALVTAELRSSARMAAICEWGSNPQRLPEAAACLQEPAAAPLLTAHESPEKSLCAVAGPPAGRLGDAAGVVGDAVESLLAANRSLIDRL